MQQTPSRDGDSADQLELGTLTLHEMNLLHESVYHWHQRVKLYGPDTFGNKVHANDLRGILSKIDRALAQYFQVES